MLKHLYIKDYVIIDEINIDFSHGMSAFTGETGAGKSIIIDAIDLLCGSRLTTNIVSNKADKAIIEGVFTFNNQHAKDILAEAGFEVKDEYIVSREITKDGKSTMRLDYRVITQGLARDILSNSVDIHNQHETQYLLNTKTHRLLLDRFISEPNLLTEVKNRYNHYHKLKTDLDNKLKSDLNEEDLEFLTYQKTEIEKANLYDGEYEELTTRQKQISAFEKTSKNLNEAVELISKSEGVLEKYYLANKLLSELNEDTKMIDLAQQFKDRYFEIEELSNQLEGYLDELFFDEDELNQIQERLFFINKLYRKYGDSYTKIIDKYQAICDRLEMINNRQEYLLKAQKEVNVALDSYLEVANKLSLIRKEKAKLLIDAVKEQLIDLQLPNTQFEISFYDQTPSAHGTEDIEFLISTNVGQPLNSLNKIASGGELSRIMLGLKTIFNNLQGIDTIIFDEIDSGVSGSIATAIGLKMHYLAKNAQVFAVTHLGQVAACADYHYFVAKVSNETTTTSTISLLEKTDRIKELALIATGKVTDTSLLAALELLEHNQGLIRN